MASSARNNLMVTLSLIIAFTAWSNAFIAISLLRQKLSALELIQLRFLPAGFICALIALFFYRRQSLDLLRHHFWRLALCGGLLILVYNFLLHFALAHVSPSAGALFTSFVPLFTMFLAFDLLSEPFTVSRAFGALIAFDGLFVVVLFGKTAGGAGVFMSLDQLPYALIVVFGCLAMALYTVLAKPLMAAYPPTAVNCLVLCLGSLPLLAGVDGDLIAQARILTDLDWLGLAFLSLICTILAYQLLLVAIKHWKAGNVNLMGFSIPPLTALFAYLYFGTQVTPFFALGGLVMLVGVIFAVSDDFQVWLRGRTARQPADG